ncbi:SusC/RagA family TonB-linked outer membrane protein, partial [Bacteroides ovatus]
RPYEFVVSRAISNLRVSLSEDSEALDEVIITGFSEEKKLNSISSVSTLDIAKNLNSKPITSISQSLQGGVTGLTVTQSSGMPGGDGASIKIRGISSLHTNNDPLVLVDGIPMDMNQLDPNTIESVTILKDAAAAAIYGARAANGVIVVKTKRGTVGKINVSYDGYFGIQKATYLPDFVNAAEYMTMANIAQKNIGGDELYDGELIKNTIAGTDPYKYPDTDWADFLFGTGYVQNHSVAVSGGGSLARFALSVNYMQNEGLTEHTSSDRLNIRANTTVSLRDNLSVNMDFNAYRTNRKQPKTDAADKSLFEWMYKTPPNTVTRYPKKAGSDFTYYGNRPNMTNPAAYIDRAGIREDYEDNISVNISPRWEVLPNLVLKGQYSYRISSRGGKSKREAYNFFDYDTDALLNTWGADFSDYRDHDTYYYLGGTAEYTYDKGDHRLFVIGGYNQELTHQNSWDSYSMISMFAKANYTYDRRYLIEGTVRRDGSSRFGDGEKFGVFPSIAAGWNVHEEKFMKSLKNEINELKLRASYGLLGNENIGLYKYQTFIDMGNGEEKEYGNPEITWEKVKMLNIGADIRLFKDLSLTFDWYEKTTSGMLITPPISSIGGTWATAINSGKVCNRGWEFSANYDKQFKDFGFSIHGGLSQNKNKIIDLFGAPYDNGSTINQIGYALNSYYVYPTDGLLQESDFTKDASGKWIPKEGVVIFDGQQPGDIKYLDVSGPDGTPDNKITTDDRVIRGNDQPDLNYFANLSFNYKKWSFEVLFQGVTGVDAYYSAPFSNGLNLTGDGLTPMKAQLDYWTPENPGARYPRLTPSPDY